MDKHQVFNTHLSTQKSPGKAGRPLLEDRCLRGPPEHHCLQRVGTLHSTPGLGIPTSDQVLGIWKDHLLPPGKTG